MSFEGENNFLLNCSILLLKYLMTPFKALDFLLNLFQAMVPKRKNRGKEREGKGERKLSAIIGSLRSGMIGSETKNTGGRKCTLVKGWMLEQCMTETEPSTF